MYIFFYEKSSGREQFSGTTLQQRKSPYENWGPCVLQIIQSNTASQSSHNNTSRGKRTRNRNAKNYKLQKKLNMKKIPST